MQGGRQDIGDIQCLFIRHRIRDREKIDITVRDTYPFCLPTAEAASQVGITENTAHAVAIHGFVQCGGVGAITGCGEAFFTVSALATSDAETVHDSLADAKVADGGTD